MQVVGIDFGTSNVRIATWDSEGDLPPQPSLIGAQNTSTMPSVIALEWQGDGEIARKIGEEADGLQDEENRRIVIRNIKRLAMSSDSYVEWHLQIRNAHETEPKWPPTWWNPEARCVQAWGKDFPVWELVRDILEEAVWRANVQGEYEWRAGCPVHSGFEYRTGLSQAMRSATGMPGAPQSIIEEPLLFLTAARRLGDLPEGAFLVYDFGGGSFDCAIAELRERDEMVIYGADGHPLLGGTDIDDELAERLKYSGQLNLLRIAKENVSREDSTETLQNGTKLTPGDLNAVLVEGKFANKSVSVTRDSYIGAKTLWKRENGIDDPPVGKILSRNISTGSVKFVWQLKWEDLARDVDGIILCGGPTKHSSFTDYLAKVFGQEKIITAEALLRGLEDAAITGASIGACYFGESEFTTDSNSYTPLYVNRIPVQVSLEDLHTGEKIHCEPYQHLVTSPKHPLDEYVSTQFLRHKPQHPHDENRYELTIATADGVLLPSIGLDGVEREIHPVDPHINTRLIGTSLRLVIDKLGRVGVEQSSRSWGNARYLVLEDTPWQTSIPKREMEERFIRDRDYRNSNSGFVPSNWREGLKTPGGRAP